MRRSEPSAFRRSAGSFASRQKTVNDGALLSRMKLWARRLRRDGHAIYLASRDPRVPWYVKFLALAVAGYALSPIDLIPDFVPIIGYLDDLIIVPLGIWFVVSLIPKEIMVEYRAKANEAGQRPVSFSSARGITTIFFALTAP